MTLQVLDRSSTQDRSSWGYWSCEGAKVPQPVVDLSPKSCTSGVGPGLMTPQQAPGCLSSSGQLAGRMELGGLLIGQLLHVQGYGPCLISLLIIFGDIHVSLRVPCVIGHPHSDRSTRNGYLEDTGDGSGRERGVGCGVWPWPRLWASAGV